MNPLIPTVHSADPAAHVWPGDDRVWIYASHDVPGTNTHDTMPSYHVFSSQDLVEWTDWGCVLHLKDVSWAVSHMWAIDACLWNGIYYLVYCAIERETGMFRTGLATSTLPQGPFNDIGFIKGVEWGQDPSLLVDDDGTPYLYWGCGHKCFACELSRDLLSAIPGTVVELTSQLTWVFEAPFVHKYRGKYYLTYPGLYEGKWPETMYYAIAEKPLGPFKFQGAYIPIFEGQAGTNHGSVIEYRGRWYAFHHSMWVSGNSACRNLMADYLEYEADGTIKPIVPTRLGVAAPGCKEGPSRVVLHLAAENGTSAGGQLHGTRVSTERPGWTGRGYVTGFDRSNWGVTVMAQACQPAEYRLRIRYAAGEKRLNKVMVNGVLLSDPVLPPVEYDQKMLFPSTGGEWAWKDCGTVRFVTGDNYVKCYCGEGGIDVDSFVLEPVMA